MEKLPAKLFGEETGDLNVFYYDLENLMTRGKVVLQQFVISFLVQGHKEINFAGAAIQADNTKALLIPQGNCLVTEKSQGSQDYKTILLFFSKQRLTDFLLKKELLTNLFTVSTSIPPYFIFEQDEFIKIFIQSLSLHFTAINTTISKQLLQVKFEEVMIYLIDKYGNTFITFLLHALKNEHTVGFKTVVEANRYSNLSIGELAFLCNMSVSTFKRRFASAFNDTPGNWFKQKRLEKANGLLQSGNVEPSDVFVGSGYKNLSHFSTAFKAKFGKSPRHYQQD